MHVNHEEIKAGIDRAKIVSKCPIFECLIGSLWRTNGQASIIIARINLKNPGFMSISCYLVDMWCLGVKDAFIRHKMSTNEYFAHKARITEPHKGLDNISYEDARSLIFGGLRYAESLGFSPHQDWYVAQYAIEPERPYIDKFAFGKDGKPYYIQGPYDHERFRLDDIIKKIAPHKGEVVLMKPELFDTK